MLHSLKCLGKRLGIETQSYGLTHYNGKAVDAAMEGFCTLVEANELVNMIRVVKSKAELKYVRKAGELGDAALKAAVRKTKAGADEGEILAAQQGAIFAGGGDYPANEFIIGSGKDALLCRSKSGRRALSKRDQLTLEWAGVYRHYHAAYMRTIIIGKPTKHHAAMDIAAREALAAVEERLRPGVTAGEVFAAHAETMDAHGMKDHRLNACGYSLGAKFTPSWMDNPMFYKDNPVEIRPGMVFFAHMILMNSVAGAAYCLGRTYIIGDKGPEPVSKASLEMIVR
jgi:Xaa-Pro dipeptidase